MQLLETESRKETNTPAFLLAIFFHQTLKINMFFQVIVPSTFNRQLESHYQYFCPAHFLGELVSGKCLAKPHFGIPKEMRGFAWIFFFVTQKISRCLFNRRFLLWTHCEI